MYVHSCIFVHACMLTSTTSCCTYLYKHVHTFLFTNLYVDINYGRVQPANQANLQIQCTKQVCNHDDDEDDNNDDDDDDDEDDDAGDGSGLQNSFQCILLQFTKCSFLDSCICYISVF